MNWWKFIQEKMRNYIVSHSKTESIFTTTKSKKKKKKKIERLKGVGIKKKSHSTERLVSANCSSLETKCPYGVYVLTLR